MASAMIVESVSAGFAALPVVLIRSLTDIELRGFDVDDLAVGIENEGQP